MYLHTFQPITLQLGSQHFQAGLSLAEIFAEVHNFNFAVVHRCTRMPEGNQMVLTLDDAKRNVENDRAPYYCDRISNDRRFKASPDWKGPGWYRMKSPAGLQLSEEPVLPYHCSTSGTGWLNGKQLTANISESGPMATPAHENV